jgi:hypothetical protein
MSNPNDRLYPLEETIAEMLSNKGGAEELSTLAELCSRAELSKEGLEMIIPAMEKAIHYVTDSEGEYPITSTERAPTIEHLKKCKGWLEERLSKMTPPQ